MILPDGGVVFRGQLRTSRCLAGRPLSHEDGLPAASPKEASPDALSRGQVRDDAVRAALGDVQGGRDVPQPRAQVLGDPSQNPDGRSTSFLEKYC